MLVHLNIRAFAHVEHSASISILASVAQAAQELIGARDQLVRTQCRHLFEILIYSQMRRRRYFISKLLDHRNVK